MSRTYLEQIEAAYQGEVYGQALYTAIASARPEPDQVAKWRLLVEVEIKTKAVMRELVARLGGETAELEASRQRGLADAQRYAALPWPELIETFARELEPVITEYKALEAQARSGDADALRLLTAHEEAALEFCRLEQAGRSAESTAPLHAFLTT